MESDSNALVAPRRRSGRASLDFTRAAAEPDWAVLMDPPENKPEAHRTELRKFIPHWARLFLRETIRPRIARGGDEDLRKRKQGYAVRSDPVFGRVDIQIFYLAGQGGGVWPPGIYRNGVPRIRNKIEMKPSPACIARLLRLLKRQGQSQEDAEDLIQDAFVRLAEYCRTAEVRNEAAFLKRTVVNMSIDRYRHHARHPFAGAPLEELAETLPLLDPQPQPDEVFAARERLDTVRRALDAVGIRTREVYLAHRAGYSHRELAAEFGVSISTIEKEIARAVVALMDMRDPQ